MTARTRYFAIASLLVLVVGLGTGLVAYYVGLSPFPPQAGTEELRLVPANASLVAFADVRHIMTSPLREKLRNFLPANSDGQRELQNHTGINIETDIDRVVAAFAEAADPTGEAQGSVLVLARGRFDVVKIEAVMRERGARVEDYKGKRVIEGAQRAGHPALSVAFLEPGLLGVGTSSLVRSAVDRAGGGPNVTANDELMSLIRQLDAGNAWAVGRFDALTSRAQLPAGVSANLPAVSWFSATATIEGGVSGVFRAETRDEQAATALRDVVRGVLSLAKLRTPARPELQQLLGSLQLAGTGKTVALSFEAPASLFDTIPPRKAPAAH
jgi:hypothetical protein